MVCEVYNRAQIASDYESEKPNYDKLVHLTNRAYDVWVPLYLIVTCFQSEDLKNNVFNSLDKISQLDGKRRNARDIEDNETGNLVIGLLEVLKQVKPYNEVDGISYYEPDPLYSAMVREENIPKKMLRKAFSRLLKRVLEIESSPRGYGLKTKRMYAIDLKKMEEYKKRYTDIQ